jgi:hypothetical protein
MTSIKNGATSATSMAAEKSSVAAGPRAKAKRRSGGVLLYAYANPARGSGRCQEAMPARTILRDTREFEDVDRR